MRQTIKAADYPKNACAIKEKATSLKSFSLMFIAIFSIAFAFQTENVFIVVFDGLRNNEGFEAGNLYLRFLVDSLAPRGTIYDHFWNTGITVTNAAHSTIATGVRQILRNNAGVATQIRPSEPTVAEYYRKDRDIAQDEVFFSVAKVRSGNTR